MKTPQQLLQDAKTVAVVGLSVHPERPSHAVAHYLQQHGYRILPVNPSYAGQEILGEKVHATLQEAAASLASAGQRIDIVDCFRKAADMPAIARDAVAVRAGCLWMQIGVGYQASADLAALAGLDVVMDLCMKIEHAAMKAT